MPFIERNHPIETLAPCRPDVAFTVRVRLRRPRSLLNSRNENTALHLEVCNTARAVLAVRPTVLSEITDIGGNSAQHRCVERTVVRSVVAGINAAHRLRGDAVVTVMQTANFGNGNNATG